MLGLITGSGFDDLSDLDEVSDDVIATPFGDVPVASGLLDGTPVLILRRHGAGHAADPGPGTQARGNSRGAGGAYGGQGAGGSEP